MLKKNTNPQTSKGTLIESILANVFCFFLCWAASYIIYPLHDMDVPDGSVLSLSIYFNLLGIVGYWIFRKLFNLFQT